MLAASHIKLATRELEAERIRDGIYGTLDCRLEYLWRRYFMNFHFKHLFLLVFLNSIYGTPAFGRTLVEAEVKSTSGCKIVLYMDALDQRPAKLRKLLWTGKCKDGYAEGDGTSETLWDSGQTSKTNAHFKRGREEGQGTSEVTLQDGTKAFFRGNYSRGIAKGLGERTTQSTSGEIAKYRGDFLDGVPDGSGALESVNFTYKGNFRDGKPNGVGRFEYKAGRLYEGDVKDSKPHGNGKFTYENGYSISGYFLNGEFPAHGKASFPDGRQFEGQMSNRLPNGQGRMLYPDRSIFSGAFKDGRADGEGVVEADGKAVAVTADMGRFTRRFSESEQSAAQEAQERQEDQAKSVADALDARRRACWWAMANGPNSGGMSAISEAQKCDDDPYYDRRPKAPSYACNKTVNGQVFCNPN